jgi:hypothetical protein
VPFRKKTVLVNNEKEILKSSSYLKSITEFIELRMTSNARMICGVTLEKRSIFTGSFSII